MVHSFQSLWEHFSPCRKKISEANSSYNMAVFPPDLSFKCLPRNPKHMSYENDKTFLWLGAQIHSWSNCNSIELGMDSQCAFVYSWHAVCTSAFLFLDGLLQNPLCMLGDITQAHITLFSPGISSYIITTYKLTFCLPESNNKKPNLIMNKQWEQKIF